MKIAVIDYGASNMMSVCNGLDKLGQSYEIVKDPSDLDRFEKVILPGVGAAGAAMKKLREAGFSERLPTIKKPLLGICLGMQLFANFSEEDDTACLGIIPGRVKKFSNALKVPQIGWNQVSFTKKSPLLEGIADSSYFYFIHSYYFDANPDAVIGETLYGIQYPSIVQKANFYATQFHPEKSGNVGLSLLRNFCEKC